MALSKLLHSQSSAPINPDGLRPVQPNEFLPPVAGWVTFGSLAMLAIFGSAIALAAVLKYPTTVKAPPIIHPKATTPNQHPANPAATQSNQCPNSSRPNSNHGGNPNHSTSDCGG